MATLWCFKAWKPALDGFAFLIHVLSDHKNLEYFRTTKILSYCQAQWSKYLSRFNFKIVYQARNLSEKADALIKQSKNLPSKANKQLLQRTRVVLKLENRLEIYFADFLSDDSFNIFFNNSLSDIDNLDFAHLQSEIYNLPARFYEKTSQELEDYITLINPVQLLCNTYTNKKDPIYDIIISI